MGFENESDYRLRIEFFVYYNILIKTKNSQVRQSTLRPPALLKQLNKIQNKWNEALMRPIQQSKVGIVTSLLRHTQGMFWCYSLLRPRVSEYLLLNFTIVNRCKDYLRILYMNVFSVMYLGWQATHRVFFANTKFTSLSTDKKTATVKTSMYLIGRFFILVQ